MEEHNPHNQPQKQEKIVAREIDDEVKASYLEYSMSVIVSRALPDIRDGLKPVHRRILYAMHKMKMFYNRPFKKSARIVGEVLGKYHPHGDTAVYDSMVRMAQPWSLRYMLVDGQGNFGSVDGDSPAAMRYTEARLRKIASEMLQDIDKRTVKFVPNFDASLKEPSYLPSKLPNLLVNGSSGIAVGMATNIPPHNLIEIADAIIKQIENPNISIAELNQTVKGPDFPTGGIILGRSGIQQAYSTGKGRIVVRAKTFVEQGKTRQRIIVSELPYMVNKALLVEETANLVRDKKVSGIADIRDESDRQGMRIVFILKQDANSEVVLNQLYKHTNMQTTFGVNMLALVNNEPKVLTLKEMLGHYITHRKNMVTKRTRYDLTVAEERAHIVDGLLIALKDIDAVVAAIKKSRDVEVAKATLMSGFKLSEKQSLAILEMRLQRLTGLEQEKLRKEFDDLMKLIIELKAILADELKILAIIKKELLEMKQAYGDKRKTEIAEGQEEDIDMQDMIKPEDMVITISHSGYIKRQPVDTYKSQNRGGKGIIAATAREEDFIEDLFIANTHDTMLFFTNKGKVKWLRVYQIPEASRQAKGSAIVNLLKFVEGEKVTAYMAIKDFKGHLMMVTNKGVIKKCPLELFSRPREGGITAITLLEKEELVSVKAVFGGEQLIIATSEGMAVKFKESDVNPMGRNAHGVRGIKVKGQDEVIGMVIADDADCLLTVTENGFGKRTIISDYRLITRGGSGVKNIICSDRNGKVVGIQSVKEPDEIMVISQQGIVIRMKVDGISQIGRATQGVTIMKVTDGDKVVGIAKVVEE